MAIARSQSNTGTAEDATSLTVQLTPLSANDFVVVTLGLAGNSGMLSVAGNNNMRPFQRVVTQTNSSLEGVPSTVEHWISERNPATPSFPTITITTTAELRDIAAIVQVFSDVRLFRAADVSASDTVDGTLCSSGTTAVTTFADECWLAGWCWGSAAAKTATDFTNGFGSSLTATSGTAIRLYTAFKVVTATGTAESTIEISASVEASGAIITFSEEPTQATSPGLLADILPETMLLSSGFRKIRMA